MTDRFTYVVDGRFRALVENTQDTIVIADEQNKIIFCNNKIFSTFGYQPEDVLQQSLTILLPPAYRETYEVEFTRYVKNYKNRGYNPITEVPGYCKDGTTFPAEISLSVWQEDTNLYSSVIIRNIVERKKWEENLEREHEFLQGILDSAEEVIIGCDERGKINFFNQSARAKKLMPDHPVPDELWLDVVQLYYPGSSIPMHKQETPLLRALRGEIIKNQEVIVNKQTDTESILVANGRQIVGRDGSVKGAVVVIHDVTAHRQDTLALIQKNKQLLQAIRDLEAAEQKLTEANSLLESRVMARTEELTIKNQELNYYNAALHKVNTDLDNFIHIASHDLKVPIINMESLLKLLHLDLEDKNSETLDLIQKLEISVLRMKKSIKAIAEIAKVQKQVEYHDEIIDLPELLVEITESIAEQIRLDEVQLQYDFTEAEAIRFSYVNLKSILYNLLTNAIKYKAPARTPEIKISTHQTNKGIELRVQDNGLGIDLNKNGGKLFTMFSRLHDHVEGSGIGLYVIKRIIGNSGGTIKVQSQLGVGSTFTVLFTNQAYSS